MARHSKWHNIKHKKMAEDAQKSKVFTKHAKLIAIAARNGGDPATNPYLKALIDNAKAENVPNDNIDRAIKKGAGADKDAAVFEEMLYEGFGPGGVAMLIQAITDKNNRALGNIKVIMAKKGGRMADAGSVSWMFKKVGVILVEVPEALVGEMEKLELELIDLGAVEVETDENMFKIVTTPDDLGRLRNALESKGLIIESARLTYEANNKIAISEGDTLRDQLDLLIETLESEDDVDEIFTNLE